MFCPRCRSEYREGIRECSDCKAPLVRACPPEPKPEYVELVEIYSTFNPADIAFIKSILNDAGIKYFFKGENSLSLVWPQTREPAKLMVKKEQVGEALELLKDFKPGSQFLSGKTDEDNEDD